MDLGYQTQADPEFGLEGGGRYQTWISQWDGLRPEILFEARKARVKQLVHKDLTMTKWVKTGKCSVIASQPFSFIEPNDFYRKLKYSIRLY